MRLQKHWWLLIPVLLLTTFLGTVLLTYDALWFDEWITHFITDTGQFGREAGSTVTGTICEALGDGIHTPLHMLCIAAIDNSWPPLFFGMMMFWDFVSGGVYYIDRTLALFIGLIAVSVTYRMSSAMFEKRTGLIAALLLGTTVFFTFYLHEIRGYTLYVLLPAINGYLYWRLLNNMQSKRLTRWGFALSIAATLYTHYIGIAVVLGIGIYHVLFERPQDIIQQMRLEEDERDASAQYWIIILKLYINACLVYGLWVAVLVISFYNESLNPRSVGTLSLLWSMLRGFSNNLWFIAISALGATLIQWRNREIRFLWVWGLTILGVSIVGNIAADFLFHPRHIMGLMPIFATLVAAGIVYIAKRTFPLLSWVVVALWVGAGIFYSSSTDFMNNIPQNVEAVPLTTMTSIVDTVEQCGSESDTFILGWNIPDREWVQDQIVGYYLGDYPINPTTIGRIFSDENIEDHVTNLMPEEIALGGIDVRYNHFVADADRAFLFVRPNIPIQDIIVELDTRLEQDGFQRCEFINRDDLVADIYLRDGAMCEVVVTTCGN